MKNMVNDYLLLLKLSLLDAIYDATEARLTGRDWPERAHTMIGLERMDALQRHVETILSEKILGDLAECGVWRGGACIFMRGILLAHDERKRSVWVCDSFAGFPQPDAEAYPQDGGSHLHSHHELVISEDDVEKNFYRYGLNDDRVCFLPGLFRDSLPDAPIRNLALLRLDADTYEATSQSLNFLYPKLSRGGILIVDDYGAVPACAAAVNDFRDFYAISDAIHQDDWTSIHWRKT